MKLIPASSALWMMPDRVVVVGVQPRADGQRNVDAPLEAAKSAFGNVGVDVPATEIAKLAGVGSGRCTGTSHGARS